MESLSQALAARFTDLDEIKDVANHGCLGGVSGFIYSSELFDFFTEHEADIQDKLNDLGINLTYLATDPEDWTFQELREKAVWFVVEEYCQGIAFAEEAPAFS
jgi:hypothetical protein